MSIIAYEDFRFRHIKVIWLTILSGNVIIWNLSTHATHLWWPDWAINCLIVILYFLLVQAYYIIKTVQWELIVEKAIGLGDLILISILALWLNTAEFIVLFPLSLVFALGGRFLLQRKASNVPLAGWLAVFFALWGWVVKLFHVNLKALILTSLL